MTPEASPTPDSDYVACRAIDTNAIGKAAAERVFNGFSFETLEGPENLRARLTLAAREAAWQGAMAGYALAAARPTPADDAERREVTVADYNDAFDPADEAGGNAFRQGFREGWIFALSPDGTDYDEFAEEYGRAVDIEPSEAWQGYRDEFFAHLPLAALPAIGAPVSQPRDTDARLREEWPVDAEFQFGQRVTTPRKPFWEGVICGWYRNGEGRLGFNVEADAIPGAIHNYPQTGLRAALEAERGA